MSQTSSSQPPLERVAFVAGLRTPFAKQATSFAEVPAVNLGQSLVNELLIREGLDPNWIERVVFGQVIQMPAAPNIAREIILGSPLPVTIDGYSVTRACATSFQSVVSLAESIMAGDVRSGIAGGADSSSVLPVGVSQNLARWLLNFSKTRTMADKLKLVAQLRPKDFLPVAPAVSEYSTGLSMGQTAEQMAKTYQISRQAQDEFALRSHLLASQAWQEGKMDREVMSFIGKPYQQAMNKDNTLRPDSTLDDYRRLKPAFDRQHGTVTAANSTALTDGAAAVVMMSESRAKELGVPILGYLKHYAFSAERVDRDMLLGPAYSTAKVLQKSGLALSDLTLIDMHEAFAAQVLTNIKLFESKTFATQSLGQDKPIGEIDMDKFNVLGGSLAYGHPFAATGARMITQTLHELKRRGGGLALNTACAAGGLGVAMILEVEA